MITFTVVPFSVRLIRFLAIVALILFLIHQGLHLVEKHKIHNAILIFDSKDSVQVKQDSVNVKKKSKWEFF